MSARLRLSRLAAVLLLTIGAACAQAPTVKRAAPATKPIAAGHVAIVEPEVAIVAAKPATRDELGRQLLSALDVKLGRRGLRVDPPMDANRLGRVNTAHAKSPVHIYREFVGVAQKKPRRVLAPADVRDIAQQSGADAVIVTRLEGVETTKSEQLAEGATSFVGNAALGVLTLSPGRIARAAANAGDSARGTHLRLTVVDGASGEILWANWVVERHPPSRELVVELVERAFSTFPSLVDRAPAVPSIR